jgi:hypothetical protein
MTALEMRRSRRRSSGGTPHPNTGKLFHVPQIVCTLTSHHHYEWSENRKIDFSAEGRIRLLFALFLSSAPAGTTTKKLMKNARHSAL